MIYRQSKNVSLYGNAHPYECNEDDHGGCACLYHLADGDKMQVLGYDQWHTAEDAYCALTGEEKFVLGKFI